MPLLHRAVKEVSQKWTSGTQTKGSFPHLHVFIHTTLPLPRQAGSVVVSGQSSPGTPSHRCRSLHPPKARTSAGVLHALLSPPYFCKQTPGVQPVVWHWISKSCLLVRMCKRWPLLIWHFVGRVGSLGSIRFLKHALLIWETSTIYPAVGTS